MTDRESIWIESHRGDKRALPLADRHYNRQKPGTPQFVPPGRCMVLISRDESALWVTSWPFAEYVKHRWAGAWVCSCFRKEGHGIASDMILEAVAATKNKWPDVPALGIVTFIDAAKVKPVMVRGVPSFGFSWVKAGFRYDGKTEGGLLAFRMVPERMPEAMKPFDPQGDLFAAPAAERE